MDLKKKILRKKNVWGKTKEAWLICLCYGDMNKILLDLFFNGKPKVLKDSIISHYVPTVSSMDRGRILSKNAFYNYFFLKVKTYRFDFDEFRTMTGGLIHFLFHVKTIDKQDVRVPDVLFDADIQKIKDDLSKISYCKPEIDRGDEIEIIRQDHVLIGQLGKVTKVDGDDVIFSISSPDDRFRFKDCRLKFYEVKKVSG